MRKGGVDRHTMSEAQLATILVNATGIIDGAA